SACRRRMHKPISTPTSIHPPQGRAEHRKRSLGNGMPVPARKSGATCASPRATPREATDSKRRAPPQTGPPLNAPPAAELAKAGELFCCDAILKEVRERLQRSG